MYGTLEDLDGDRKVDLVDYAMFTQQWGKSGCGDCGWADLIGDKDVDFGDLREFTVNWLAGVD